MRTVVLMVLGLAALGGGMAPAAEWEFHDRGARGAILVHEAAGAGRVAFECPNRGGADGPSLAVTRDLLTNDPTRAWSGVLRAHALAIGPGQPDGDWVVDRFKNRGFVPIPRTGWMTHDLAEANPEDAFRGGPKKFLTIRKPDYSDLKIPLEGLAPHEAAMRKACELPLWPRDAVPSYSRFRSIEDFPSAMKVDRPFLGRHIGFAGAAAPGDPHAMKALFLREAGTRCAGVVVLTILYYMENWPTAEKNSRWPLPLPGGGRAEEGVVPDPNCPDGGRILVEVRWNDDSNERLVKIADQISSWEAARAVLDLAEGWSGDFATLQEEVESILADPPETLPDEPDVKVDRGAITTSRSGIGWSFDGRRGVARLDSWSGAPMRYEAELPEACSDGNGVAKVGGFGMAEDNHDVPGMVELGALTGQSVAEIVCDDVTITLPILTEVSGDEGKTWFVLDRPSAGHMKNSLTRMLDSSSMKKLFDLDRTKEDNPRLITRGDGAKTTLVLGVQKFGARILTILRLSTEKDGDQDILIETLRRAGLRVPIDRGQDADEGDWPVYVVLGAPGGPTFRLDLARSAGQILDITLIALTAAQLDAEREMGILEDILERRKSDWNNEAADPERIPESALLIMGRDRLP